MTSTSDDAMTAQKAKRADALFISVIGIVALLVAALAFAFTAHSQLQARTLDTIELSRDVRNDALHIAQALADLEVARRGRTLQRRGASEPVERAVATVRSHLETLQRRCAPYPALNTSAARVTTLVEQDLRLSAAESDALARSDTARTELWGSMEALMQDVGALNDETRGVAERTRAQLDMIAIALGVLSLAAAGLAVASIRRERLHWRLAHAAAEDARASAAASDLAKTRFLAVASHDMRQPLHALALYLSSLERRVEGEEARGIVAKMDLAVQSMIGMFASLLDLARLQAGVVAAETEDAALQPIFASIAAEHPGGAVDIAATDLAVRTDPRLLARIISNLVANAVKHGGSARVSALADGADATIVVADDGPGIAPEDQERIFEEFERLGARSDGLGLGLTIVRRMADLIGAHVTLKSTAGKGARFSVRLPLAPAYTSAAPARTHADALRGITVLAMDDDTLAREALAGLLTDLGAEVRACANGEEALAAVESGYAPRLLFLDLRIEGQLRGLDVATQLRARLNPAPPVVMITGDTEQQTLEALRASGHVWLIKPINPDELGRTSAALLAT